jgi:hypothetical protein
VTERLIEQGCRVCDATGSVARVALTSEGTPCWWGDLCPRCEGTGWAPNRRGAVRRLALVDAIRKVAGRRTGGTN